MLTLLAESLDQQVSQGWTGRIGRPGILCCFCLCSAAGWHVEKYIPAARAFYCATFAGSLFFNFQINKGDIENKAKGMV